MKKDNSPAGNAPEADSGNASNPSPHNKKWDPAGNDQLLNKRSEKFLRESGNIEDLPDAQDQQEMDDVIKRNK